jgi:hypothetical protein
VIERPAGAPPVRSVHRQGRLLRLTCAAIAHNLTRAAGALAGGRHTRARTATLRTQLIHTPARVAHSAHHQTLHLPRDWPWEPGLDELFRQALHDPLPATA